MDLSSIHQNILPIMSIRNLKENFIVTGILVVQAVMTMVPEAWQNDTLMPNEKRDFYHWAACAMEPWDGPALLTFTDGRYVGAILDRNGLRPSRFYVLRDNVMVMASEVGVYDTEPENVVLKVRKVLQRAGRAHGERSQTKGTDSGIHHVFSERPACCLGDSAGVSPPQAHATYRPKALQARPKSLAVLFGGSALCNLLLSKKQ
jgi:hypothetical protein